MKQLLILSGKGGTGKTTLVSSFIKLKNAKMYADCDVDAPNLHLVVSGQGIVKHSDFYGMQKAYINQEMCVSCGKCYTNCRFDAIEKIVESSDSEKYSYIVNEYACEGCGVCEEFCDAKAVSLKEHVAGDLILKSNETHFSTAKLRTGSGNSGLLVSEVKKQLKDVSKEKNIQTDLMIIDGSPGIGCPVIASLTGVDMVLIVTEPTLSGLSDLERIVATAEKLQVKQSICVNKFDLNTDLTDKIKDYSLKNNIPFLGVIPFDKKAIDAVNDGKSVVEVKCKSGDAIKEVFANSMKMLEIN
jgi:MinD superfamily P-loop ATPase